MYKTDKPPTQTQSEVKKIGKITENKLSELELLILKSPPGYISLVKFCL